MFIDQEDLACKSWLVCVCCPLQDSWGGVESITIGKWTWLLERVWNFHRPMIKNSVRASLLLHHSECLHKETVQCYQTPCSPGSFWHSHLNLRLSRLIYHSLRPTAKKKPNETLLCLWLKTEEKRGKKLGMDQSVTLQDLNVIDKGLPGNSVIRCFNGQEALVSLLFLDFYSTEHWHSVL